MNEERELGEYGAKIKHLRKQRGLTQPQLSGLMGISKQALSAWEQQHNPPSLRMLKLLCEALGCTKEEIYNDAPAPEEENAESGPEGARKQHVRKICRSCGYWQPMTGTAEFACHWGIQHTLPRSACFTPQEESCDGYMPVKESPRKSQVALTARQRRERDKYIKENTSVYWAMRCGNSRVR